VKHNDFTDLVRVRRSGLGLTQMDMAQELEISQSHYAQFESGRKTLSMNHILKLLEILQLEILPKSSGLTTSWVSSFLTDTNSSIEEVISNLEQLNVKLQENIKDKDPV
jgi:transcriptional regulator with XRE-family HTH domain